MIKPVPVSTATQNACKLCAPLGASLAFRGVEGAVSILHGSQGCATYIRRHLIGHFREPMDIASSSFGEMATVFGGGDNLRVALRNVIDQYHPRLIGVASTCLSETIGDDLDMLVQSFKSAFPDTVLPEIVTVSTPSYCGTHMDGFHAAVRATVEHLVSDAAPRDDHAVNLFLGMFSPADIRYLREIAEDFGLHPVMLPDYSDTLDGPSRAEYDPIPSGGTPIERIAGMSGSAVSLSFSPTVGPENRSGATLESRFGVPERVLGFPIGIAESDNLFHAFEEIAGCPIPDRHALERDRLIDSYVDGHKFVFGKRAVVYGEEDFVVGMATFLAEIGVTPCLCASGGTSGRMREAILARIDRTEGVEILDNADFAKIEEHAESAEPDFAIGNSKGYGFARRLGIPLIRVGFPIHDRIGAQRLLHVGYRGTQHLFDRVVNAMIEVEQDASPIGYGNY
jgi:nitrogenase molybdenum-iron protein NifN